MYLRMFLKYFKWHILKLNIDNSAHVSVFPHWALGLIILGYGAWFCQFDLLEFADSICVHSNRTLLADRERTGVEQVWHETDCLLFSTVCWFNLQTHSPTPLAKPVKTQGPPKRQLKLATRRGLFSWEILLVYLSLGFGHFFDSITCLWL